MRYVLLDDPHSVDCFDGPCFIPRRASTLGSVLFITLRLLSGAGFHFLSELLRVLDFQKALKGAFKKSSRRWKISIRLFIRYTKRTNLYTGKLDSVPEGVGIYYAVLPQQRSVFIVGSRATRY